MTAASPVSISPPHTKFGLVVEKNQARTNKQDGILPSTQNGDASSSGVWQEEECHRYGDFPRNQKIKKNSRIVSDNVAAVARCVPGKGLIKVNGRPLKLFAPEILRAKLYEPILLLGTDKFADVDIRIRVSGGGHTSQVYATRQAVCPSSCPENNKREGWVERLLTSLFPTDCQGDC